MNQRIQDKINEIELYLKELESIKPPALEKYENDIKEKAACERYFEKIIKATIDLAFLVIKTKSLETPEDDKDAFNILMQHEIIDESLCNNLKNAKGMKNIIAHQYGKVDDKLVFESITHELIEDVDKFIDKINIIEE